MLRFLFLWWSTWQNHKQSAAPASAALATEFAPHHRRRALIQAPAPQAKADPNTITSALISSTKDSTSPASALALAPAPQNTASALASASASTTTPASATRSASSFFLHAPTLSDLSYKSTASAHTAPQHFKPLLDAKGVIHLCAAYSSDYAHDFKPQQRIEVFTRAAYFRGEMHLSNAALCHERLLKQLAHDERQYSKLTHQHILFSLRSALEQQELQEQQVTSPLPPPDSAPHQSLQGILLASRLLRLFGAHARPAVANVMNRSAQVFTATTSDTNSPQRAVSELTLGSEKSVSSLDSWHMSRENLLPPEHSAAAVSAMSTAAATLAVALPNDSDNASLGAADTANTLSSPTAFSYTDHDAATLVTALHLQHRPLHAAAQTEPETASVSSSSGSSSSSLKEPATTVSAPAPTSSQHLKLGLLAQLLPRVKQQLRLFAHHSRVHLENWGHIWHHIFSLGASVFLLTLGLQLSASEAHASNLSLSTVPNFNYEHELLKQHQLLVERYTNNYENMQLVKQPANKTEKCLLSSEMMDGILTDNSFIFWEGFCENGLAEGFGRVYVITNGRKAFEMLTNIHSTEPQFTTTYYTKNTAIDAQTISFYGKSTRYHSSGITITERKIDNDLIVALQSIDKVNFITYQKETSRNYPYVLNIEDFGNHTHYIYDLNNSPYRSLSMAYKLVDNSRNRTLGYSFTGKRSGLISGHFTNNTGNSSAISIPLEELQHVVNINEAVEVNIENTIKNVIEALVVVDAYLNVICVDSYQNPVCTKMKCKQICNLQQNITPDHPYIKELLLRLADHHNARPVKNFLDVAIANLERQEQQQLQPMIADSININVKGVPQDPTTAGQATSPVQSTITPQGNTPAQENMLYQGDVGNANTPERLIAESAQQPQEPSSPANTGVNAVNTTPNQQNPMSHQSDVDFDLMPIPLRTDTSPMPLTMPEENNLGDHRNLIPAELAGQPVPALRQDLQMQQQQRQLQQRLEQAQQAASSTLPQYQARESAILHNQLQNSDTENNPSKQSAVGSLQNELSNSEFEAQPMVSSENALTREERMLRSDIMERYRVQNSPSEQLSLPQQTDSFIEQNVGNSNTTGTTGTTTTTTP